MRLIAFALCLTMLISQPLTAQAIKTQLGEEDSAPSGLAEEALPPLDAGDEVPLEDITPSEEEAGEDAPDPVMDFFFRRFRFLSYKINPNENYAYNSKYAFQWLFGFNIAYDAIAAIVGCIYDTIRCTFSYEGRDWMVQLWKGAYLYGLCTGGEIGLYSKPSGQSVEHYQSAAMQDWIGMEFTIYYYDRKLFTRPMEDTWWATGYEFHIFDDMTARPRRHCTMDSALRFPNAEMAALFAQSLAEKGFTDEELPFDVDHPEHYALEGDTVRLIWQGVTEGFY